MVMVEIDSNAILLKPLKSRQDSELIRGYDSLVTRLRRAGVTPKKHILDNEISTNMKNHIRDHYQFQLELVPPGCHRRNAAEVAIRNFKAHFLSVLVGTADSFPPSLWDRLLPQTEITLNLLRQSNATPTVSAYAHLSGPFDYNKMPLAPMGCEVLVHEKTDKRGSWAFHCVDGWYLNTSPEHYRVHNCHIKDSRAKRLSNTVQFKHKQLTNPELTPQDKIMHALANRKAALMGALATKSDAELDELQRMIALTQKKLDADYNLPTVQPINQQTHPTMQPSTEQVPRVQELPRQHVPRVQDTPLQPVPRVPQNATVHISVTPTVQRGTRRRRQLLYQATHLVNPTKSASGFEHVLSSTS